MINIKNQLNSKFLDVDKQVKSKYFIDVNNQVRPIIDSTIDKNSYKLQR